MDSNWDLINMDKVSLKDIYDLIDNKTSTLEKKLDHMSERVSLLEVWKAELTGKIAIVTATVVILVGLLQDFARKKLGF